MDRRPVRRGQAGIRALAANNRQRDMRRGPGLVGSDALPAVETNCAESTPSGVPIGRTDPALSSPLGTVSSTLRLVGNRAICATGVSSLTFIAIKPAAVSPS